MFSHYPWYLHLEYITFVELQIYIDGLAYHTWSPSERSGIITPFIIDLYPYIHGFAYSQIDQSIVVIAFHFIKSFQIVFCDVISAYGGCQDWKKGEREKLASKLEERTKKKEGRGMIVACTVIGSGAREVADAMTAWEEETAVKTAIVEGNSVDPEKVLKQEGEAAGRDRGGIQMSCDRGWSYCHIH